MSDITSELNPGDRFRFEKAIVESRKITDPKKIQGSGSHRGSRVVCSKGGIVYIDKTWNPKEEN